MEVLVVLWRWSCSAFGGCGSRKEVVVVRVGTGGRVVMVAL